jgi:hypothetical protein
MAKRTVHVLVLAAMAASSWVRADSVARQTGDGVRDVEIQQAQVKTQVQQAADDVTSIIAELQRNGIGGDDVTMLQEIHGNLDNLSASDMAKVIALLQQARSAGDISQWRAQTTAADVDQTQILVKMRQVLLEYKRQQDLYDMSLRLNDLAQRQNVNLKEAKQMMRSAGGSLNPQALNDLQKSSAERQVAEEQAIQNESKMLTDKLNQMAGQSDAKTAQRLKQCLDQANQQQLDGSLSAAVNSLKEMKLGATASAQKNARDSLYDLSSLVAPAQDSATKLAKAAEKLDQAIAEEKAIAGQTHNLTPPQEEGDKDAFYQVEDRQADNVDQIDRMRKSLDVIAPAVTNSLKAAQNQMQESRGALNSFQPDSSLQREQDALSGLEQARDLLQQQMNGWDEKKRQGDALAQSKAMKDKIAKAIAEQQKINDQTDALQKPAKPNTPQPSAQDLAKQQGSEFKNTRDLQSQAASDSVETAKELSAAADDMDAARSNLEQKSPQGAQPSQRSASEHLANAEKSLDQQISKLEKAEQDLAAMENSRKQIAKLIEGQQKVALDTAKQSAKPSGNQNESEPQKPGKSNPQHPQPDGQQQPSPPPTTQQNNQSPQQSSPQPQNPTQQPEQKPLAQQQAEVSHQTDMTRQSLPDAGQSAASSLDQAHQEMKSAENSLQQQQSDPAKESQQQALNDLQRAKSHLDQQISQKQRELGQPQDQQQQMEQMAQQLRQSQQQLSDAQEQMDQSSGQQSAEKLGQVSNQVTSATANDQGALPSMARQSLQQAEQSLNQASGDAQANQPTAKAEAQAGQNAISQALAALAQAQKGSDASAGPSQPPNEKPSNTPPSANSGSKQGQSQSPNQGKGQASGSSSDGQQASGHRQDAHAQTSADIGGTRGNVTGSSSYLALPARDRQAIQQTQGEKYPEEYGPAVEEYLKNLSDQDGR